MRNPYYKLNKNLLKHLFVDFRCPNCGERIAVALHTIHKKARFQCTECHKMVLIVPEGEELDLFAKSFDQLYAQLQSIGLNLMFFPDPYATIWKSDDKP